MSDYEFLVILQGEDFGELFDDALLVSSKVDRLPARARIYIRRKRGKVWLNPATLRAVRADYGLAGVPYLEGAAAWHEFRIRNRL